ncbi:MAG: N-acetylmuramoyl-L-alanine amidase [Gemmatimonadaceae bacterium]
MMLAALALLLQATGAAGRSAPAAVRAPIVLAAAQPESVVVRGRARVTSIRLSTVAGVSVVAADKLAIALGGTFRMTSPGHYSLTVGDSHISFTDAVPFAGDDSTIVPMPSAPSVSGGKVLLPFFVVTQLVPRFFSGYMYDAELREVRVFDTAARRVVQNAPPPPVARVEAPPMGSTARDIGEARAVERVAGENIRTKRPGHRLIVVDAGHGGVDPGMHGPIGGGPQILEKNITLPVAKLVAQALRDAGADVLLTRTTDTLIGLYDRGPIANKARGDVFVSIHVNATGQRGAAAARDRGYETYFLAEAKTEDARRVARMENQAVRFETGNATAAKGDPLNFIINDMAQNEHLRESADLAESIESGFRKFHPGPDRGVQQADFAVLRGAFMPAVLVEIGFGTNRSEAAYISDPDNQLTIARSIAKSILTYMDRYDARVGGGASGRGKGGSSPR